MAKLSLLVAIIFSIIAGCIGVRELPITWTRILDNQLLDMYYTSYPPDIHIWGRVKQKWDGELPHYNGVPWEKLKSRVCTLQNRYKNEWQNRSWTEREQMDDTLARIYKDTEGDRQHHELRMLNVLFHHFPQYKQEPEIIRNVVYRWYERYAPLGKEILASDVDWTPGREAYLRHVAQPFINGRYSKGRIIKAQWLQKYYYINIKMDGLLRQVNKFKNDNEGNSRKRDKRVVEQKHMSQSASDSGVLQRRKTIWNEEMETDLFYINNMIRKSKVRLGATIKERWDRMQQNKTYFSENTLLKHAYHLQATNFKPDYDSLQNTKRRYGKLPPIPEELFSTQEGKQTARQLRINEGYVPTRQQQDEFEFPSGLRRLLQQDMPGINTPYAGNAYYPHQTEYHGSSSDTPFDQGHFALLPDTPHQQFRNLVGSSSHNSIQPDSSGSLLNIPQPHQHFWSLGASSSHNTIQPDPSGSLLNNPQPNQDFWSTGAGSSYTSIHEDPSGLIAVTSRSRHHQPDYRDSSNHTSIHEDPSGLIAGTPRPRLHYLNHSGSSNHTSVHQVSYRPQADTPRPYRHQ